MQDKFLELFKQAHSCHTAMSKIIVELEKETPNLVDLVELADLSYCLKQAYAHLDENRKQVRKLSDLVAQIFTLLWSSDPMSTDKVQTDWCTCTPDPRVRAGVPSPDKDPEGYARIMRFLGVPEDMIKLGALQANWSGLGDMLTEIQRSGKPIPDEFRKTYTEYAVRIYARKKLPTGLSSGSGEDDLVKDGNDGSGDDQVPF